MCIGAIGAVVGVIGQVIGLAISIAQYREQKRKEQQNRLNAIAAANDKYAALARKADQEAKATSQKTFETKVEAVKKEAEFSVSAADAGVTGISVEAVERDAMAIQARREAAIFTNFETKRREISDQMIAAYHEALGRGNFNAPGPDTSRSSAQTGTALGRA